MGQGARPTFLGGVNGMIVGLVGITPAAGYVNGLGAIMIGLIDCVIVWLAWNFLSRVRPFSKVDDALGVVYTHGIAGLFGGLLVGLFADPKMIEYLGVGKAPGFAGVGLFYGHPGQVLIQAGAAITIIVWDALVTFLILRGIGLFTSLRMSDELLETGDVAVHGEEAYPVEEGLTRVDASGLVGVASGSGPKDGPATPRAKITSDEN